MKGGGGEEEKEMNGEEMRREERSGKRERGEESVSLSWRRAEGWRIISCSKSKIMSHYNVSLCQPASDVLLLLP